VKDSEFW